MGEGENGNGPSTSTKNPSLNVAVLLITSLIHLSHSIKVFTAKWQTVRNKLEELFSNLTAIDNCELSENLSLSIAVESILSTLNNCEDLAKRCLEFSYSGKLLMQSDLDMLSAKLDGHIKNSCDIYAAGLLTQSHAIVVSRPKSSASKHDMRFYVDDIMSRLRIGSCAMKKQALVAFNEVIQEDDRYVKIAVEIDGLVNVVVNLLDFQEGEVQEEAARAVCLIAGFEPCKSVLIGAGAIAPLIRVMESGSKLSKKYAARCLLTMTENSDNGWAVSAHGGVPALLKICCSYGDQNGGDCGMELVCLACAVLKNLVGVEEIKRFMVEEGAIVGLVELARSKNEAAQISSLDLLQTMAYRDESMLEMIIKEEGIQALVHILDPKSSVSTKTREVAFRVITNICFTSEVSISIMINYGFMDHILYFLRQGEVCVQELALKAAFWLSGTSEEAKKIMGNAGFMPVLVRFLDSKSFEQREMAAETLSSMMIMAKNRKKFIQNDQNIDVLLQMLDPDEVNFSNKKLLLSILLSLTSSSSARKKIVNSEHLKNIEKLAEAEVSDAKKIIRKLSSSRLRNVLNVFWHS